MKNTKRIQLLAVVLLAATASVLFTGCATPRTKWTDKTMRTFIDPSSIDANNYVRIQQALVSSKKWIVVDRAMAYRAIKAELERTHRTESDMFMDKEKYAIWGRLLGVGGIVVAHVQCQVKASFWAGKYNHCQQFLSIVDTNTGEVIATSENDENGDVAEYEIAPSWEDTVAQLNDNYPSHFEKNKDDKILDAYKELAGEEAVRQKEKVAQDQVKAARAPASDLQKELPVEVKH